MKRFILDTTELKEQRRLENAHFRVLVRAQRLLGDRVCISEVSIREYVRHTRQRLEEQLAKRDAASHELCRVIQRDLSVEAIDVERESVHWERWLRSHLASVKIEILPLPAPTHEQLLQRDLDRRKPFANGKGYRDALIWMSVLEDAQKHADAEVVLVTANTSDFAQGETLHPDLQHDVDLLGGSLRVVFAPNLQAAVERHVSQRLPPSEETQKVSLQQALATGGQLHRWLLDKMPGSIERVRLGVNGPVEEARVVRCQYANEIIVTEARRIEDEIFAEIEAHIVADLVPVTSNPAPWLGDTTDSSEALVAAGRFVIAHLLLSGTKIAIRFGLTVNASGTPSAMDVWDARIDDNVKLLESLVPRAT